MEAAAESMNSIGGVGGLNNQSTFLSQAPANGTLQIQIQHGFTEGAHQSGWTSYGLRSFIARRD